MKRLIAIMLMGILFSPVKAQWPAREFRNHVRTNHSFSKYIKPNPGLKSRNMANKPTLDSCVYLSNSSTPGTGEIVYKDEFRYDPSGIPTLYLSYDADPETKQWVPTYKEEVEFDGDGNLTLYLESVYFEDQFVPEYKTETAYKENGLVGENIYSSYMMGDISYQSRDVYEYDDNNFISSIVQYSRSNEDEPWVFFGTRKYITDDMGREIADSIIDADINTDGIVNNLDRIKETFDYDAEGNLVTFKDYGWDNELNDWYNSAKTDYTYNVNSKQLTLKSYRLNEESG